MTAELQDEIGKARTATVGANCMTTELVVFIEELKAEAEGWRRRNLIMDSQVEAVREVVRRLEAVAEALGARLSVIADLDRLDISIKKLTTAVLKEAADEKPSDRGKGHGRIKVKTRRGQEDGGQIPPS